MLLTLVCSRPRGRHVSPLLKHTDDALCTRSAKIVAWPAIYAGTSAHACFAQCLAGIAFLWPFGHCSLHGSRPALHTPVMHLRFYKHVPGQKVIQFSMRSKFAMHSLLRIPAPRGQHTVTAVEHLFGIRTISQASRREGVLPRDPELLRYRLPPPYKPTHRVFA